MFRLLIILLLGNLFSWPNREVFLLLQTLRIFFQEHMANIEGALSTLTLQNQQNVVQGIFVEEKSNSVSMGYYADSVITGS